MKMRKLLATGVAASVAVTSLATVASAEEVTFDMAVSSANQASQSVKIAADLNDTIGTSATQREMQIVAFDFDFWHDWEVADKETNTIIKDWLEDNGKITMVVKGTKIAESTNPNVQATAESVTKEYKLAYNRNNVDLSLGKDNDPHNYDAYIVVLDDKKYTYRDGEFAPAYFDEIDSVEFNFSVAGETNSEEFYKNNNGKSYDISIGATTVFGWDGKTATKVKTYDGKTIGEVEKIAKEGIDAGNGAAAILAFATTKGGYKYSTGEWMTYPITRNYTLKSNYPFMAITDGFVANDKYDEKAADKTLTRQEIYLLSASDSWFATNGGNTKTNNNGKDDNQTYNDDTLLGTDPYQFAGLASQVADFFNKQTNGTIKFTFTADSSAAGGSGWLNGGVPSTQVGIKNAAGSWTNDDFALFFNYNQTGSLQAVTSVDKTTGEVTFDISSVLDELGGQTKGVIDNIYYGLTKGIDYDGDDNGEGLKVLTITLAYDEDADIEEDVDADVEIEDDVEIDEDDDVEIDEDDDVEEDDAEDDANVGGDVIVETEDDDANPGTGVALAVIPALVAAAAVVVSKKRS